MQQEIIAKQRRLFDMDGKLVAAQREILKLKDERDRLVHISNELRAELNKAKRTISEYKGLLRGEGAAEASAARVRFEKDQAPQE